MNTIPITIFALINLISFGVFLAATYRLHDHKTRYPLAEKGYRRIIGGIGHGVVVAIWLGALVIAALVFGYFLIFHSKIV